jgi:hypothetical protein
LPVIIGNKSHPATKRNLRDNLGRHRQWPFPSRLFLLPPSPFPVAGRPLNFLRTGSRGRIAGPFASLSFELSEPKGTEGLSSYVPQVVYFDGLLLLLLLPLFSSSSAGPFLPVPILFRPSLTAGPCRLFISFCVCLYSMSVQEKSNRIVLECNASPRGFVFTQLTFPLHLTTISSSSFNPRVRQSVIFTVMEYSSFGRGWGVP